MTQTHQDASAPARRYAANCSILFTERSLLQRPAAARAAGFDAVEFWWPFSAAVPDDHDVDQFVAAVADAGVKLIGLNFAAGDMPAGDRGLMSWPGRETELRDSIAVAAAIGQALGTKAFNALYGNRLDDAYPDEQDELAIANLTFAAQSVDGFVLVEPLSGAPRYPLRTAADVIAVLERVGAPGLRLLADLYHLAVNGDDLSAVVTKYPNWIGHVQIADAPGRHEPGTGTLDLDTPVNILLESGYPGWIGLEYVPTGLTEDGLTWLADDRRVDARPIDARPIHQEKPR